MDLSSVFFLESKNSQQFFYHQSTTIALSRLFFSFIKRLNKELNLIHIEISFETGYNFFVFANPLLC